ncbi:hypothetical protein FA15DRAFT_650555 [Coprinopsis marcescibilis]|uniref:Uncharacterized protein n=1 Tax=Coprinopsis marcescibilis TaxID=230819 RepID=A0A5C3KAL7_COPMA|nr:hypothetical protein FA15DRAFT_650555 [Coprinopsis marcescibilis]
MVDDPLAPAQGYTLDSVPYRTCTNPFGIYRIYPFGRPTYSPDHLETIDMVTDSPTLRSFQPKSHEKITRPTTLFPNSSVETLMVWYHSMNTAAFSRDVLESLVTHVLRNPTFSSHDFDTVSMHSVFSALDNVDSDPMSYFAVQDHWISGSIKIPVPVPRHGSRTLDDVPEFTIDKVYHRNLMDVIRSAFAEPASEYFHTSPYESYWQPSPNSNAQRLYDEMYSGDRWIKEHRAVVQLATAQGCQLEPFVISLMAWSDETHLTQFGSAKLWPIYIYFGNLSKHTRGKPSTHSAHHVAYIPPLPDTFSDWYLKEMGTLPTEDTKRHVRRELVNAIWRLLLDSNFRAAYREGVPIKFWDDITRQGFPRFITYSGDYPEKVLHACIKYLTTCLCPQCLVPRSKAPELGTGNDRSYRELFKREDDVDTRETIDLARTKVYIEGRALTNKELNRDILGPKSLTPTRSAFSLQLGPAGLNVYSLFAPDLLHEFEIGVWKAVFFHLIRIIRSFGHEAQRKLQILNERFRSVPPFGRDTIRRIYTNPSDMKRLAARDYEDFLQIAIAVFQGLFGEPYDRLIELLLFELATWHALAKLRHLSDVLLTELDASTTRLGRMLREFADVTLKSFKTQDLPSEVERRARAKASKQKKSAVSSSEPMNDGEQFTTPGEPRISAKERHFNLLTYKVHSLGHYVKFIRECGTTDNWTTQHGEAEHRRPKRHYVRAAKGAQVYVQGIARQQRRERVMYQVATARKMAAKNGQPSLNGALFPRFVSETPPRSSPSDHHSMSKETTKHNRLELRSWLQENANDPAFENFLPKLQAHLRSRLLEIPYAGDEEGVPDDELMKVVIVGNTIYRHAILRVNHTTYDRRRDQESFNPRTQADIMLLAHDDTPTGHPYWYARIVGVFHLSALYMGGTYRQQQPHEFEVVWVRWFGPKSDPDTPQFGWKAKRLPRIGFVDPILDDSPPFGFLDPSEIIRGIHLIPDFTGNKSGNGLGPTSVRPMRDEDKDWNYYYIGWFSHRDLFMRFRGGGVGHTSTREAADFFLGDRDEVDVEFLDAFKEGREPNLEPLIHVATAEELQSKEERRGRKPADEYDSASDSGDSDGSEEGEESSGAWDIEDGEAQDGGDDEEHQEEGGNAEDGDDDYWLDEEWDGENFENIDVEGFAPLGFDEL